MQSRRRVLLAGAALGVLAPWLAACDPGTVVDNGAGNNTSGPGGGSLPSGPGANGTGDNSSGNNTTANTTGGDASTPPSGGGSSGGGTLPPGPRVRYDVASPQGQAMLAVYARAVGLMMALPDGDPRSWTFQWYSHWVKGAQDLSGKTSEIARIYGSAPSPERTLAQKMWSGCQAHGDNEDENFFLPWHRMYVLAFENIVRSVANEPNFTLPYWNYLDPAQRAIPSQFRRPGDPTWGVLYRSSRNPAVNAGGAIASSGNLTAGILSEGSYSPLGADQGFCANLDFGLHGTVHVGVGNAANGMGVVPWAANDPVFWLHHCNIDRLWASWNQAGNPNPSDGDFTAKPFVFAGPNGAQVSYTVGQMLSLSSAGYGYDVLLGEDGQPAQVAVDRRAPRGWRLSFFDVANAATTEGPPPAQIRMRAQPVLKTLPSITHVAEGVQLGGGSLRVRLTSTQAAPDVAARALAPLIAAPLRMQKKAQPAQPSPTARLFSLLQPKTSTVGAVKSAAPAPAPPPPAVPAPKPGQKVFLVLNDLSTDIQPGVLYQIYLEAPRKGGGAPEPFAIGTLNFFSAMRSMGGMKMASRARSFDITDLAAQLAAQNRLEASPALRFEPMGRPADQAQPLIGSVSLAIQ